MDDSQRSMSAFQDSGLLLLFSVDKKKTTLARAFTVGETPLLRLLKNRSLINLDF